ncbi:metal ABC transporter ATP-binding protein [Desulfallas thermosapovorans]|uniref:Zinc transport system ATP-binding protein n=1 Tax=Desulfallas thermosapovorans DSM 6562 TaxID=1121431 RepID=A0A5S5A125_9FIRM|nr:metal ABC transporter ATP-binding protein [Desulfallas thermosapovorans]TYO97997.1 zinc transport system ATP-binding protein [Desulfallas thermosapovorans DSM 6562]
MIELNNVHFTYGCHPVLDGISLHVHEGEVVGITGPNGAGKSTLLYIILGLLKPQSGEVKILGVPVNRFREWHRIGYVSQRATLFNRSYPATVFEVVLSGRAALRGMFRFFGRGDKRCAEEALERVNMLSWRNTPISALSGGQQQRVMIARALAVKPRILVMDEPTNGVDAANLADLARLLKDLRSDGVTMLLVSHEPEWLSSLASRRVCLDRKICSCHCHDYPGELLWRECTQSREEKISLDCADSLVRG